MESERYKLNLQGLLRFAIDQNKSEDSTTASAYDGMDEERKQFLETAFKTMTVDVIKEFHNAINILEDTSTSLSDKQNALNVVREYIDDIDFANNFVKVDGTKIILQYLKEKDSHLRVNAIYIVAEMSQNNPFCQKHFVDADVISLLLSYLTENEDVASSSLHAISALIRNFEPGLIQFLKNGGVKSLLSCLNTSHTRVFVKACFVIATLALEKPEVRDEFVKQSAITKLLACVEPVSGFDIKAETVLFALSELSKSPEYQLQNEQKTSIESTLHTIIASNKNLPQCEEIVSYATAVLESFNRKK